MSLQWQIPACSSASSKFTNENDWILHNPKISYLFFPVEALWEVTLFLLVVDLLVQVHDGCAQVDLRLYHVK